MTSAIGLFLKEISISICCAQIPTREIHAYSILRIDYINETTGYFNSKKYL